MAGILALSGQQAQRKTEARYSTWVPMCVPLFGERAEGTPTRTDHPDASPTTKDEVEMTTIPDDDRAPDAPVTRGRPIGLPTHPSGGHPLLFVTLAYTISWAWVIPLAVTGATVVEGNGWPTHLPALLGPLLAAVLCTALAGCRALRALGASMLRWRIGWRWWLAAVSPLLALVVVLGALAITGVDLPAATDFARFSGIRAAWGIVGVGAVIVVIGGLGEETGWRGYLQPALQQRLRVLPATGVVAVAWAAWHLPQFFLIATYENFPVAMLPVFLLGLAAASVVLAWLYNRTHSVLLCAVWHGTYNIAGATAAASAGSGVISAVIWTFVVLESAVLLALHWRAIRARRPSVLSPRMSADSLPE
jgi:membrane protease YdiL (CAAX protease family)